MLIGRRRLFHSCRGNAEPDACLRGVAAGLRRELFFLDAEVMASLLEDGAGRLEYRPHRAAETAEGISYPWACRTS